MEYRSLGRSGLQISALSFGAWVTFGNQVDVDAAVAMMGTAFDAGVNFFDNAEAYADGVAEEIMGAAIRKLGWRRSEYLVSTKIFWGGRGPNQRGLSRKHILEGTDAALRRFGLDYVDLIYCHRPDILTPVEETVRAMSHVVGQGKALYWGTSEWPADRILEAYHVARRERLVPPLMEQPEYSMLHRDRVEREYAPLYERVGLGTTVWSPLAGGLLTGKYRDGIPAGTRSTLKGFGWLHDRFAGQGAPANLAKVESLRPIADELGCSRAQLALAWCLANPHVSTVILGASRIEQLRENLGAMDVAARLTPAILERIEQILDNRPEPEKDWR
ncbi:MAG TPA: aldo/keto reductase [Thermoanaerobaculales bacterium]|nr:aldo/keto reductase [Thermoanaerobaculales bacterium]HQL30650.1 aldo/keto reductase [Thermoanaerobaculales bacterium]HQN95210.1 aldo/keto reductase [Thermoanaerobaculales bacterium]HQP42112.1 aldo/keto reductase [Thermoanaerobaculales bacterium]